MLVKWHNTCLLCGQNPFTASDAAVQSVQVVLAMQLLHGQHTHILNEM